MTCAAPRPALPARGDCPSVHHPFAEVDGALTRVRLPGGRLDAGAARAVAAAAAAAGAGPCELTNRANLQLRAVPADRVEALAASLVAAGVAAADPDADARRNVVASPAAGIDPDELLDAGPLVAAIAARLAATPGGRSPKFAVLLDGGGAAHVRGRRHDLSLGAVRAATGAVRVEVRLDEPLPVLHPAGATAWTVDPRRVLDLVDAVLDAVAGTSRVADLLDVAGPAAVWAALGATLGDALAPTELAARVWPEPSTVGVHPQRPDGLVCVGAAPPLRRLPVSALAGLADLADQAGSGELRVAPWGAILVPGVPAAQAAAVTAAATRLGLVCDPDHPALAVVACAGRNGCAAGRVDTHADAARLIDRLASVPRERRPASVHLSGCDKGCARPGPADVSLVGAAGTGRYDVYARGAGGRFGRRVAVDLAPAAALDAALSWGASR